jgi:transcriptional regulator with XRE-family HTH domain
MTKLSQYLTDQKIRQEDFATLVGATQATISRLARGQMVPGARLAMRIQNESKGAVPFESWFADESAQ